MTTEFSEGNFCTHEYADVLFIFW